ncbi:MAG: PhnD/SsuA/transferrin family substrate-binding protein [bacterium]
MNKKRTFLIALFAVAALSTVYAQQARAEKYVFVVPIMIGSTGPEKASGAAGGVVDNSSGFLKRICDIIKKKTGDDFVCEVVNKPNDAMLTPHNIKKYIQSIESKKFAGLYISGNDYYSLVSSGYDKTVPAAQISFKKKTLDQACLFTRSADAIGSIEELKGKTWSGSYFYMGTRFILYKNGIDMPLKKFFGKTVLEDNDFWINMADQLLAGKIDVFAGSMEEEIMGRARDKKYSAVKTLACVPFRSTHMIVFNKANMSKEKMEQIRGMLLAAHKDKDWGPFQFIFAIINGHFVPFNEESFKVSKEFVDTSENRGWLKEQLAFIAGK